MDSAEGPVRSVAIPGGSIDLWSGQGRRGERTFHLTETERSLLRYLAERAGDTVDKAALLKAVWGYRDGVISRAVDTAVRRLRQKMGDGDDAPAQILTVRSSGYRFLALEAPRSVIPPRRLWGCGPLLARLDAALAEDRVALTGPPGVGKTTIAAAYSETVAGGLLWISACDRAGVERASRAAAAAVPPALIVLDGADALPADCWPLLDRIGDPAVRILITARSRPPGGLVLPVPPLPVEVGAQMLLARAPLADPAALDPGSVRRLVLAVGSIPLGITLAARELATSPIEAVIERLERRPPAALQQQIVEVIDALAPALRRALVDLAVFAGSFTLDAASRILGVEPGIVSALVDASLVQAAPERERHLHLLEPVAAVVRPLFEASADRPSVTASHRAYWASRAWEAWDGSSRDMAPIGDDWAEVIAAARLGPLDDDGVALLCWAWEKAPLQETGPLLALFQQTPVTADPRLQVRFLRGRARSRMVSGEVAAYRAGLREVVQHAGAHGLLADELSARAALAMVAVDLDNASTEAREEIDRVVARAAELERGSVAWIEVHLEAARIAKRQGDAATAERWFQAVLQPMFDSGDLQGEAVVRYELALGAEHRGDRARALCLMEDALQLAAAAGEELMALRMGIRRLLWLSGEPTRRVEIGDEIGRVCLRADRLGNPLLLAEVLQARGLFRLNGGDHLGAEADLLLARTRLVALSLPWTALMVEGLLGVLEQDRGRWLEASGRYQIAIEEAQAMGASEDAALWLAHLARALRARGERAAAEAALAQALQVPAAAQEEVALLVRFIATPGAPPPREETLLSLWWWRALARIVERDERDGG
jgi:tetratricopeptide (TPR) repeat protein